MLAFYLFKKRANKMYKGEYLVREAKRLINSAEFQLSHRMRVDDFKRKRKLPFEKIFVMILKLVKKACKSNVNC